MPGLRSGPLIVLVLVVQLCLTTVVEAERYDLHANLTEGCPIGTLVVDLVTTTGDLAYLGNSQLTHRILDLKSKRITTTAAVDREIICPGVNTGKPCVFEVEISYGRSGDVIQDIFVHVTVLDINDNRPRFPEDEVEVNIAENASSDERFEIPAAFDRDTARFGIRGYYLEGEESGPFNVRQIGSRLFLQIARPLDREEVDEYKFKVIAKEKG